MANYFFTQALGANTAPYETAGYIRTTGPDGTIEWWLPDVRGRILGRPVRTRHQNQQRKAHWRKANGKSSYRQRQASARAAKAKRAQKHPVST